MFKCVKLNPLFDSVYYITQAVKARY